MPKQHDYSKLEYKDVNLANDPKYKGVTKCPFYSWSNLQIKNILAHLRDGKGAKWIAKEVCSEYSKQMSSEVLVQKITNNKKVFTWEKINPKAHNEYWDLEALQVLAACISRILSASVNNTAANTAEDVKEDKPAFNPVSS